MRLWIECGEERQCACGLCAESVYGVSGNRYAQVKKRCGNRCDNLRLEWWISMDCGMMNRV